MVKQEKLNGKKESNLKESFSVAAKRLGKMFPIMMGVILLVSLFITLIPKSFYVLAFRGNVFIDSFIGAIIGSISTGIPITSYIIGGELLEQGISLVAVTAFIVTWVTVGVIQFPAEAFLLGKKFALRRNVISFIFSIIVAILTVLILGVI